MSSVLVCENDCGFEKQCAGCGGICPQCGGDIVKVDYVTYRLRKQKEQSNNDNDSKAQKRGRDKDS